MSAKNINDPDFENDSSEVVDSSYDETYEDDATYTEDDSDEWSDDTELSDDAGEEDEQPAPQKKKTSNLTIAIIFVVAVIGVFGFMILKGNNASAPQPVEEGQVAINADADNTSIDASADPATAQPNIADLKNQGDQNADGDQTISIKSPTPTPAQPQQGLMDNPNLLASDNNTATTEPTSEPAPALADEQPPTLTAPDADPVNADASAEAPAQDVVKAISPTVKPVSDFPTVDSIKKPDAGTVDQAPVTTLTASDSSGLPVPVQTSAQAIAQDDKAAKLQVQLNDSKEKIALLEKQLSDKAAELDAQKQIAAKASVAPVAAAGASDAEVDALKDKIADLEEKLAAKATKPVKTSTPTIPERKVIEEDTYSADEPIVKKTADTVKPKPVVKQQAWSLKSVGSGKAILSDKATGDLKTVRVGDVVSGLGRIISISSSNSGWVVKGTLGSVFE